MRARLRAAHAPAGTSAAGAPPSRAEIQHTSVRRMRLLARAPRLLAVTVAVVLVLAGLRTVVFGTPAPKIERVYEPAGNDVGEEGFTEAFARAYLSWSGPQDTEAYDRSLAAFNPQFANNTVNAYPPSSSATQNSGVAQDTVLIFPPGSISCGADHNAETVQWWSLCSWGILASTDIYPRLTHPPPPAIWKVMLRFADVSVVTRISLPPWYRGVGFSSYVRACACQSCATLLRKQLRITGTAARQPMFVTRISSASPSAPGASCAKAGAHAPESLPL